jgi:short-subunit dehydrogenase
MPSLPQRIVITGASMGIGAELAVQCARAGSKVVVAARTAKALDEVVSRCGGNAFAVPCDVESPDQCRALIEQAAQRLGGIDALVNNAGILMRARFDEVTDLDVFEKLMRVNYLGAVHCTYHALPHLKSSRGLIVAVSSVGGLVGVPTRSGYAASKHAMQGFFDSLRIELMGTGVDVLVVSPGPVATGMHGRAAVASAPVNTANERGAMPTDACARLIAQAMEQRRHDLVTVPAVRLALVAKQLAPRLVDRVIARRARGLM